MMLHSFNDVDFHSDAPRTWDALLEVNHDTAYSLPDWETRRIEPVAAFLKRTRQACTEDGRLDTTELLRLFDALEAIGARGWYVVMKQEKLHERWMGDYYDEIEAKDKELEELRQENRRLREESEMALRLSRVVERLEPLVGRLEQRQGAQEPVASAPPPDRPGILSDISEDDQEVRTFGSGRGEAKSQSPQEPKESQKSCNSSTITEAGDALSSSATSYPPPLAPSTEEATQGDDTAKQASDGESNPKDDVPQLRGGALSLFSDLASSPPSEDFYMDQIRNSLGDWREENLSSPLQEDYRLEHEQLWIDRARILQLENASRSRMIDHLEQIINDVEATVEWQDEELACAHRRIRDLERKAWERRDETSAAGRRADLARAETRVLQEQPQQIHDQVTQFCAELEESERRILQHYPDLFAFESPEATELRGGADSPQATSASSCEQVPSDCQTEETALNVEAIEASSFYWFPSVSMVVLLTNPLHHFQFPKHTSLARVHQMLSDLHDEDTEAYSYLRQVREILEVRDEAGIGLPDTSNGRQVLISAPEIKDDSASVASGKPGYKGTWNRTFGPAEYQYEHMLKDSIENLKPPTTGDRPLLSPEVSVYQEISHDGILVNKVSPSGISDENDFYNAGDLINTIEHEAELSRVRSAQKLAELCKEVSASRHRADNLGEKRGYAMSLPLPPTELGPMFPTGSGVAIESTALQPQTPLEAGAAAKHLSPQPVGRNGVKAWRLGESVKEAEHDRVDERRSVELNHEQSPSNATFLRRNPLSLERLFTALDTDTHPTASNEEAAFGSKSSAEQGWAMWRHRKNEGCESWIETSTFNPNRERCIFCGLPFAKVRWKEWEFHDETSC
ncbi:hypothetical protein SLS60_003578 [Paraconiothyrium brasiliense]|uniref:Uncharacterized protein n=1 Tax=Paraconiothyrium brasiliense TaxID=300254 RepID=A0ABR3RQJ6_9PLEO